MTISLLPVKVGEFSLKASKSINNIIRYMDKGKLVMKVDLKATLLEIEKGQEVELPIKGFTVNTVRSTATRLNAEGCYGNFSVSEDYNNKRILVSRS